MEPGYNRLGPAKFWTCFINFKSMEEFLKKAGVLAQETLGIHIYIYIYTYIHIFTCIYICI